MATKSAPTTSVRRGRPRHRRGNLVAIGTAVTIAALVGHRWVPAVGGLGLIWESLLPWTAVLFGLGVVAACIRRSARAGLWVTVGVVVWAVMFVPQLRTHEPVAGDGATLTVASQNVNAMNESADAAARALVGAGADVVALQELGEGPGGSAEPARAELAGDFPYSATASTVEVWSKYPLTDVTRLDLGMSWDRTLHATLRAPGGDISLYVAHLPSVRPGQEASRNRALAALSAAVRADGAERVLVVGDLNASTFDRNLRGLLDQLEDSRRSVGGGFGFTWPSNLPVTRPDHVLSKGMTVLSDDVLPAHGSDHSPLVVKLRVK